MDGEIIGIVQCKKYNERITRPAILKEIETILPEYEKMYQSILYQLYGAMGEHPENLWTN